MTKQLLLMQRGDVVGVVLGVSGVGNHSYDCAFQRSPPQQPLADQVHVPRRIHAEPYGGAREEHPFMGQQQGQTPRYLNGAVGRHCFQRPGHSLEQNTCRETRSYLAVKRSNLLWTEDLRRTFKIKFSLGPEHIINYKCMNKWQF